MRLLPLLSAILVLLLSVVSLHFLHSNYWSNLRWLLSLQSSPVADLVVRNALIYTSDASLPFADSMAVSNGRILRVGNYSSVVQQDLPGYGTKELNLEGKIVVPGFIDSHVHFINGGLQMAQVELRGINNRDEFVRRVQEAVKKPNGLLIDSAMKLLLPWIPEVSVDERREALVRASNLALMRGVTTVVDFGRYVPGTSVQLSWEDFSDVYHWTDTSGKMMIRVCLFFPMETWSHLLDLISKTGRVVSQWIYLGGVKGFADGSLGSNSALFYEPYVDDPHNYGLLVTELESLFNMTMASDKSGLQVAIHAIGDKANDLILDVYESVGSTNGMRDRRFRIEHAQHLVPGSTARFGEQGIVASVQPDHLLDDADPAIKKLGVERAQKESHLFRSLLASNAQLAFGSDWPVADINPLGSIKAAMKRIPPGWESAWISSECLTLHDAVNAYTISAARASFLDNDLGSLSPGKMADFVVLSTDSWDDFAAEGSASVEATFVGGLQAYP
ncbi:protein LONG AFTER FAR-RED 3 isoform X7 [Vitis riparia]|uniref:protein LONG AFTER FAR-RED 3 isoform X7 n=1 Tax=Vitis riparia TaxID=96939 RepID=UPI00155B365D|nr:protein LONG AFTER FAR-RED 3 isoform X7 [Vitis riparia]